MTRSVADAAAMLRIIAGFDERDPSSSREPVPDYLAEQAHVASGLRIGIDWGYVEGSTDPEQVGAVRAVAGLLADNGHQLVDVNIPYHAVTAQWPVTTAVEALHAHRETWPARRAEYGHLGDLLELGESFSAQDYMLAEMSRREFAAHFAGEWARCDVMLSPSFGLYAPPREGTPEMDEAEGDLVETLKFTAPFDASGSPTLSIPWQAGSLAIPTSIQLIGQCFEEATLVALGQAIESWRGPLAHPG